MTPKRRKLELVSSRPPEAVMEQRFHEACRAWLALLVCPWSRLHYSKWRTAVERLEAERLRYLIQQKDR